jgi:hypothetical protein
MHDPTYVGAQANGRAANILVHVLLMAFVVAAVLLPLMALTGGA